MMSETDDNVSADDDATKVKTDGKDAAVNTDDAADDDALPPPEPPWPPWDYGELDGDMFAW